MALTIPQKTERTFDQKLAVGTAAEKAITAFLMRSGLTLIPLYQFQAFRRPPRMILPDGTAVAQPDITCLDGGQTYFIDVKAKDQWGDWPQIEGLETGTDLSAWDDYVRIRESTGRLVWLYFVQHTRAPQGVFIGEVAHLLARKPRIWTGGAKPKILFQQGWLHYITTLEDIGFDIDRILAQIRT